MFAFHSKLFWKAFLSVLLGVLIWLPIFYWLTVPLVNRLAYEIEEAAARTVLNNVVQIVAQSHRDLQAWRQSALDAHKRELKDVIQLTEGWIKLKEAEVAAGKLSKSAARRQILEQLRQFRYGNNDYVWAADYRSTLVSHPDAEFHGKDASTLRDAKGELVIPPLVEQARKSGDGYFSYWWRRLDTGRQAEKLSYFRHFPAWQLVIGTGVYIDDVDQEVARRQEVMIGELRKHLHSVRVARSGYVFVMDAKMNAIIHPDSHLEGSSLARLVDPASEKILAQEFIDTARRPDETLFYEWNRPDDPDHYHYRKVAWVNHVPEYDWYLGATAYTDDLGRSGQYLAQRILVAFLVGLVITTLIALAFIRHLTAPILRLADLAKRNVAGDLSAVSNIDRSDEIGVLARAFNNMVARLKDQIENLEQRVAERTREISVHAAQLEARNREIAIVDQSLQSFQVSENVAEVRNILSATVATLLPGLACTLHLLREAWDEDSMLFPGGDAAHWLDGSDACWAVRRGAIHRVDAQHPGGTCCRAQEGRTAPYLCIPLTVRGTTFGVLHVRQGKADTSWQPERVEWIAHTLAGQVALTLANLRLQESLRQQSIRDPLSQLYNRRYLQETLGREEHRCRREQGVVGVIMLDIDHFKSVNDNNGHEAGDMVICTLARLLSASVRGGDIACRFGGEEFVLVMPGANLALCAKRAEEVRRKVEALSVAWHGKEIQVTISAGVAIFPEAGASLEAVIAAADGALYEAKRAGRNRVVDAPVIAPQAPPLPLPA